MSDPAPNSGGGITTADRLGSSPVEQGVAPSAPAERSPEALDERVVGPGTDRFGETPIEGDDQAPEASAESVEAVPDNSANEARLPVPGEHIEAIAARLRIAANHARLRTYEAIVGAAPKLPHSMDPGGSYLEQSPLEIELRAKAQEALSLAYPELADHQAAVAAFDRDAGILHGHLIDATVTASRATLQRRADLVGALVLRYSDADQRADLGLAAAVVISCRSTTPFILASQESVVEPGAYPSMWLRPDIDGRSGTVNAALLRSFQRRRAYWLPWATSLEEHEAIVALLGPITAEALRADILETHPILRLVAEAWSTPSAMVADISDGLDPDEEVTSGIGRIIADGLIRCLADALDEQTAAPDEIRTEPQAYEFVAPIYLQIAAQQFVAPEHQAEPGRDPLWAVVEWVQRRNAPAGRWATVDMVLIATGLVVLGAALALGPAFAAGALVLELTIGAIGVGMRSEEFLDALRYSEASKGEELFRLLDPKLQAFENGMSAWSEGGFLLLEIVFAALPALDAPTAFAPRSTAWRTAASGTDASRGAVSLAENVPGRGALSVVPPGRALAEQIARNDSALRTTMTEALETLPTAGAPELPGASGVRYGPYRFGADDVQFSALRTQAERSGTVARKDVWNWFNSSRKGLGFSTEELRHWYNIFLDFLGAPTRRRDLRRLRGYNKHTSNIQKLYAHWAALDSPLAIRETTEDGARWMFRVDDSPRRYARSEIDIGHVLDVVVYDKFVFLVESEILELVHQGKLPESAFENAYHALRRVFMEANSNLVPELPGPNRANALRISYRDDMTMHQALDLMLSEKAVDHLPSNVAHPLEVFSEITSRLLDELPASRTVRIWDDLLANALEMPEPPALPTHPPRVDLAPATANQVPAARLGAASAAEASGLAGQDPRAIDPGDSARRGAGTRARAAARAAERGIVR